MDGQAFEGVYVQLIIVTSEYLPLVPEI